MEGGNGMSELSFAMGRMATGEGNGKPKSRYAPLLLAL